MPLTNAQVDAYRRDGVLPLGQVLDSRRVAEARERLDAMIAAGKVDRPESVGGGHTIRRLDVSRHDPWFDRLVRSDEVLDAATSVLGPDLQYYQDNFFYKPAGVGGATPWHQDNIWWNADPPDMLSLWIALDDVDDDNGAVRYVPGSHAKLAEHTLPVHDPMGITYHMLDPQKVPTERAVSFTVPAGHAVMHHCLTMHGSPPNASPRPRRGYTVTVMRAGLLSHDTERFPLLRGRMAQHV